MSAPRSKLQPVLEEMARGTPAADALVLLPLSPVDEHATDQELVLLARAAHAAIELMQRVAPEFTPTVLAQRAIAHLDGCDDEMAALIEDVVTDLTSRTQDPRALRALRADGRMLILGFGNLVLGLSRLAGEMLEGPPLGVMRACFAWADGTIDARDD